MKSQYQGNRICDKIVLFYIRNIPNHPFKIRILYKICDFFFKSEIELKNTNGSLFRFSINEYLGHEILFSGDYEPRSLNICQEIMKEGGIFIDIGANLGLYTITISSIKNTQIYAIEPTAINFSKLINNVNLNNIENIELINIGLTDVSSFGYLVNPIPKNAGTFQVIKEKEANSYLVKLVTLSEIIKHYEVDSIKLIKIDVEGYELKVFKGFFNENVPFPENIIMEFTDYIERTEYTLKDCYEYLTTLGYLPYNILGQLYQLGEYLPESNLLWKRNFN